MLIKIKIDVEIRFLSATCRQSMELLLGDDIAFMLHP
jgi:hypothetical protein